MLQDGPEGAAAKRPRGGTAGRQGARASGGARRSGAKTVRLQLHLGEKTVERLGVHASLVHADKSRVVEEVLLGWLSRYGRGRELFGQAEGLEGGEGPPGEP
jgi:hypothetical protein